MAFICRSGAGDSSGSSGESTALLLFPDLYAACEAIAPLRDAGAAALELMDRASLRAVEDKPGVPADDTRLPKGAAALLVEFQTADVSAASETAIKAAAAVSRFEAAQQAYVY